MALYEVDRPDDQALETTFELIDAHLRVILWWLRLGALGVWALVAAVLVLAVDGLLG
jgi:hypothetical protein